MDTLIRLTPLSTIVDKLSDMAKKFARGDEVNNLPVDNDAPAETGDLEMMYNLFNGKSDITSPGTPVTASAGSSNSFAQSLKLALLGGVLFVVFSLPPVYKLANAYIRNPILAILLLALLFMIVFFLLQKLFLKC